MTTNLSDWLTSHAGLALLVFSRTLGLAWTAPALSTSGLELRYRVVMAALLAGVLVPAIGGDASFELGLTECLAEAIVGAGIGWSAALVVAGARQAGDLVVRKAVSRPRHFSILRLATTSPHSGIFTASSRSVSSSRSMVRLCWFGHWWILIALSRRWSGADGRNGSARVR